MALSCRFGFVSQIDSRACKTSYGYSYFPWHIPLALGTPDPLNDITGRRISRILAIGKPDKPSSALADPLNETSEISRLLSQPE